MSGRWDAVVVGGGHNGLVAAALLARAGRSVLVLERLDHVGGAAVSERPFPGVDARLSRFSYLVSLLPRALARELGLGLELRRRRISSYTPRGDGGLLVDAGDAGRTRASLERVTGDAGAFGRWEAFHARVGAVAGRLFPTFTEPLRSRADLRALAGDDATWDDLVEQPLGRALRAPFPDDLVRGVVLTDGLIGTFAAADDPSLAQNRCFLYHVVGNGTGDWDVPVGGMGAVTEALASAARAAGATLRTGAEVAAVRTDGRDAEVELAGGEVVAARDVLCGAAPAVLARLLGEAATRRPGPGPRAASSSSTSSCAACPACATRASTRTRPSPAPSTSTSRRPSSTPRTRRRSPGGCPTRCPPSSTATRWRTRRSWGRSCEPRAPRR